VFEILMHLTLSAGRMLRCKKTRTETGLGRISSESPLKLLPRHLFGFNLLDELLDHIHGDVWGIANIEGAIVRNVK